MDAVACCMSPADPENAAELERLFAECLWLVLGREGGEWPLQWAGRFIGSWVGN